MLEKNVVSTVRITNSPAYPKESWNAYLFWVLFGFKPD